MLATSRRLLDAERAGVSKAVRGGLLTEDAGEHIARELDERVLAIEHALTNGGNPGKSGKNGRSVHK